MDGSSSHVMKGMGVRVVGGLIVVVCACVCLIGRSVCLLEFSTGGGERRSIQICLMAESSLLVECDVAWLMLFLRCFVVKMMWSTGVGI